MEKYVSPLTRYGQVLYHMHRDWTRNELDVHDFIELKITAAPDKFGTCLRCENYRKLIDRTFCLPCVAGTLRECDW